MKKIHKLPVSTLEQRFQLHLVNLNLVPIPFPTRNLYKTTESFPPAWPRTHPFHWLAKAKACDSEAMLQLGLIYHRANKYQQAKQWYQKAEQAGHPLARERLVILEKTK